jgi:tetratricopeptide (TPR) repeat protein
MPSIVLPPIWNVPHLRNPNFTGRAELLDQLETDLGSGRPMALSGRGGIGKTQLATEYAYRHASQYEVVWWVRADEPAALAADYATLAHELARTRQPEQQDPDWNAVDLRLVVTAVRRWLQQHAAWLLVFDNASEPRLLDDYLPPTEAGHVLITSRNPAWYEVARASEVDVLPRADAIALLLKLSGQTDEMVAGQLAEELGDLPLALVQAGAHMQAGRQPLVAYLKLFQSRSAELLERGTPSNDYPSAVATTWELAFEQVEHASAPAANLLKLCAYLAPDDIPRATLSGGAEQIPEPLAGAVKDRPAFDDAVERLQQYSLLAATEESLSVHRLVQAITRAYLPDASRRTWAAAAVRLLAAAVPSYSGNVENWTACAQLLPHALSAAAHAGGLQVEDRATLRLLNQVAGYLEARAQFQQAQSVVERALDIAEKALGPEHPETAGTLNNLGRLLQDQGDLAGARLQYGRALAIWEKTVGEDDPRTATTLNNIGMLLKDQGDLAGARPYLERALDINAKVLGPDHPGTAASLTNLGMLSQEQGDVPAARAYLERALAIAEKAFGPDHHDTATSLDNLGMLLRDQGDLAGARPYLERALDINAKVLGPDHPETAISLNNLGMLLRDQGDLAGARPYLERALAIREKVLGPRHPGIATSLSNLAGVLYDQGDVAGTRALFERILAIREEALGPYHPETATSMNNLGMLLQHQGDLAGARPYLERALDINAKVLGPRHPNTAMSLNNLAGLLHAQGDLGGARPLYERAFAMADDVLGPDHPTTAMSLNNLAGLLRAQGDLPAARALYARALRTVEKVLGPDHPNTAMTLYNLATVLRAQGDLAGARALYERALAINERVLSPDHPYTAMTLSNLASLMREQGDLDRARQNLEQALAMYQRSGDRHQEGVSFLRLGELAAQAGRQDMGARLKAVGCLIHKEIEHPDREQDWRNLKTTTDILGYSSAQVDQLIEEVSTAYQSDQGQGLLQAAFAEAPAEEAGP